MTDPVTFESTTPRHALPLLFPGQTQKEATLNEALIRLDLLTHTIVEGERADPPENPQSGESWIVSSGASGEWGGHERQIACFSAGIWHFLSPNAATVVFDKSAAQFRKCDADWQQPVTIVPPMGGQSVDFEARQAIGEICQLLREAGLLA